MTNPKWMIFALLFFTVLAFVSSLVGMQVASQDSTVSDLQDISNSKNPVSWFNLFKGMFSFNYGWIPESFAIFATILIVFKVAFLALLAYEGAALVAGVLGRII